MQSLPSRNELVNRCSPKICVDPQRDHHHVPTTFRKRLDPRFAHNLQAAERREEKFFLCRILGEKLDRCADIHLPDLSNVVCQ